MLKRLSLVFLASLFLSLTASAQSMEFIGEGVRENTTLSTFESYKLVHYAASFERSLSPSIARSLHLTMLAEWGMFFTKDKMVGALEQALVANTTDAEFRGFASEISRFKKTLLALPINKGSELQFQHTPGEGLTILMKGPRGLAPIFKSSDQNFSMKIFSIWLGQAHPDANNRASLERLIANLWQNAH